MVTQTGNTLELKTPYDAVFLAQLKAAIPYSGCKWNAKKKVWLVDVAYSKQLNQLLKAHYNYTFTATPVTVKPETRLIQVEYIGACKDRGSEISAFGYTDGNWNVIFPETVLRNWFEFGTKPTAAKTLYNVLSVQQTATETELKKAYRRLAKQWHPDICREPNATEMFRSINHAYEILSNPQQRRKYNAGLALTAQAKQTSLSSSLFQDEYRPPLRCGWLMVKGMPKTGNLYVEEILQWEDITDNRGRVMVSSWPAGADIFEVNWI